MDPHIFLSRVSDEDDPTLEVGKHAPKSGEGHDPPDGTTIPSEASDPYTITNDEPGGDDTGLSDILTYPNPSLKTPSPKITDLNDTPVTEPTNSKEYTITTETLQTHQHGALGRPKPEPPYDDVFFNNLVPLGIPMGDEEIVDEETE